jgi:hypothetical protein
MERRRCSLEETAREGSERLEAMARRAAPEFDGASVLGDAWLNNGAVRLDDRCSGGGGRWWGRRPCQWLGQLIRPTAKLVAGASWQRCLTPMHCTAAVVEASGGNTHSKAELGSTPPAWDGAMPEGRRADRGGD